MSPSANSKVGSRSFFVRYALAWSLAFCASFAVGAHLVYREMSEKVSGSLQSRWLEQEELIQRSVYGLLESWPRDALRLGDRLREQVLQAPSVIRQEGGRSLSDFADTGSDLLYLALWTRSPNSQGVRLNGAWNSALLKTESPSQLDWAARSLDSVGGEVLKSAWEGRTSWRRIRSQGIEKEIRPLVRNEKNFHVFSDKDEPDYSVIAVAFPLDRLATGGALGDTGRGVLIPELQDRFPSVAPPGRAEGGNSAKGAPFHDVAIGYFRVTRLDRVLAAAPAELGFWMASIEGQILSAGQEGWTPQGSLLKSLAEGEVFPLGKPQLTRPDFRGVHWTSSSSRGAQLARRLETPNRDVMLIASYPQALLEPSLGFLENHLRNWALGLSVLGIMVGWSQARARSSLVKRETPIESSNETSSLSESSLERHSPEPKVEVQSDAQDLTPSRHFRKLEGVFITWRIQDSEGWSKSLDPEKFVRSAEEYRKIAQSCLDSLPRVVPSVGFHLYQESVSSFEAMVWNTQAEVCTTDQFHGLMEQLLVIRKQLSELVEARKTDGESALLWEMAVHLGEAVLTHRGEVSLDSEVAFWSTAEEGVHRLMRLCGESGTDVLLSQKFLDRVGSEHIRAEACGEAWLDSDSGVIPVYAFEGYLPHSVGEGWKLLKNHHYSRKKVARSAPEVQFSARKLWWVNNGNQILGPMKDSEVAAALFAQEIDFDCECWAEGYGETATIHDAGIFGTASAPDAQLWVYDGKTLYGPLSESFARNAWERGAIPQDAKVCSRSTTEGWTSFGDWISRQVPLAA